MHTYAARASQGDAPLAKSIIGLAALGAVAGAAGSAGRRAARVAREGSDFAVPATLRSDPRGRVARPLLMAAAGDRAGEGTAFNVAATLPSRRSVAVGAAAGAGVGGLAAAGRKPRDGDGDGQLDEKAKRRRAEKAAPAPAIPLSKAWADKLPGVLEAAMAIKESAALGFDDDLALDSEEVAALIRRVVAHCRKQGMAKLAGLAEPGPALEALVKGAPDLSLLLFCAMQPAEQADFLGEGDAVLEALGKVAAGDGSDELAKRALDLHRLFAAADEPELIKFWAGAAMGAGRVATSVGAVANRWSGNIRGYMGSRLSGLMGMGSRGMARVRDAVDPPQASLGLSGGGMGGMGGMARRGAESVRGYGQRLRAAPMATMGATAKAGGRHVYENRGGYGVSGGMALQQATDRAERQR